MVKDPDSDAPTAMPSFRAKRQGPSLKGIFGHMPAAPASEAPAANEPQQEQPAPSPSFRPAAPEAQAAPSSAGAATLLATVPPAPAVPEPRSFVPDATFGPCGSDEPPAPAPQTETVAAPQAAPVRKTLSDEPRVILNVEPTEDDMNRYVEYGVPSEKIELYADATPDFARHLDVLIEIGIENDGEVSARARRWYQNRHPVVPNATPATDPRDAEITQARTTPRRSQAPVNVPAAIAETRVAPPNPEPHTPFAPLPAPQRSVRNAPGTDAEAAKPETKPAGKKPNWLIWGCIGTVTLVVLLIGVQCARQQTDSKTTDAPSAQKSTPSPAALMSACEPVTTALLQEYFGQNDPSDFKQNVAEAYRNARAKNGKGLRKISCNGLERVTEDAKLDVSRCCVAP